MTSEAFPSPDATQEPGDSGDQGGTSPAAQGGGPYQDRGLNLTDPKAIRALAHPVRWALLEALGQAGTLTATQASEMLGESRRTAPFTCGPWPSTASSKRLAAERAGNGHGVRPTTG